jgi:acyl carrier protein
MSVWTHEAIANYIKHDLLLDQLRLADTGVTIADIQDDTPLLGSGLSIDSVDALDLLVGVEKKFGLTLPDLNSTFIEMTCADVGRLIAYVEGELAKKANAAA